MKKMIVISPLPNECILAFSGGVDSSFGLHFLTRARRKIHCLHINHNTSRSAEYEAFCIKQAAKYNCSFRSVKIEGTNEHEWHVKRYEIFHSFDLPVITCHQKDDNLENLLMFGRPMPYRNKNVIRPFLNFTRKKIMNIINRYKIDFIQDASNLDIEFTLRNKVRSYVRDMMDNGCPLYLLLNSGISSIG